MGINNYFDVGEVYSSTDNTGTAFLAFKNIDKIIKKYSSGIKTLDYGCGSGSSTRFLKELGLAVEGVDISSPMIAEAKKNADDIIYNLFISPVLPYENETFDIVFSSFVLFEISSLQELKSIFNEIFRILKKGGIFISVTGSEHLYTHQWLSLDVDFVENKNLKSGDIAKIVLKDADLLLYDYFWKDSDYQKVINSTDFNLLEKNFPLGEKNDGYEWKDEEKVAPYVIYVLSK